MPVSNLRQADIPEGCWTIAQMPGTAPGLVCPYRRNDADKIVYAVPGVPFEMRIMLEGTVIPELRERSGDTATIKSRTLKTWGMSEARLGEIVAPRLAVLDETGRATIAFLASGIEGLKVRVTAKAATAGAVDAILDEEEMALRAILGDLVFGIDDDSMESVVLELLREKGWTLAVAESLTGGMVGSRLTMIPSASEVFCGGVVSYAARIKREVLGVSPGPVVREETAREMASGVRRLLGADVGLSTTGAAGPEPLDGHDAGSVFLGIDIAGDVHVEYVKLPGDRERVREYAVINLLNQLRLRLLATDEMSEG
jgi:nicotinamide-nucleotide amidase